MLSDVRELFGGINIWFALCARLVGVTSDTDQDMIGMPNGRPPSSHIRISEGARILLFTRKENHIDCGKLQATAFGGDSAHNYVQVKS